MPNVSLGDTESVAVVVEPFQSEFEGQAEIHITIQYLDGDKNVQTFEASALEPLLAVNNINDALRNVAIDLRRIKADTLPPAPAKEVAASAG
jgi:hypothetical protein